MKKGKKGTSIIQVGVNDVLCGRGNHVNCHPGNEFFQKLVKANKPTYSSAPKYRKASYSVYIVDCIKMRNPEGRFVKKDKKTGAWFNIGRAKAINKVRQALREKVASGNRKEEKIPFCDNLLKNVKSNKERADIECHNLHILETISQSSSRRISKEIYHNEEKIFPMLCRSSSSNKLCLESGSSLKTPESLHYSIENVNRAYRSFSSEAQQASSVSLLGFTSRALNYVDDLDRNLQTQENELFSKSSDTYASDVISNSCVPRNASISIFEPAATIRTWKFEEESHRNFEMQRKRKSSVGSSITECANKISNLLAELKSETSSEKLQRLDIFPLQNILRRCSVPDFIKSAEDSNGFVMKRRKSCNSAAEVQHGSGAQMPQHGPHSRGIGKVQTTSRSQGYPPQA